MKENRSLLMLIVLSILTLVFIHFSSGMRMQET